MTGEAAALLARIRSTEARIGIIGLGYVGLPLAVEFARAGFDYLLVVDKIENPAHRALDDGAADPKPIPYAQMNREQRTAFMSAVVLPQMKQVFTAFDPKFQNFSCVTCHGNGVRLPHPDGGHVCTACHR